MSYARNFFKVLVAQPLRQPARVLHSLFRQFGPQRRAESEWMRRAVATGTSIVPCADCLRPARHTYAGYSGPWVEDAFFEHWTRAAPRTKLRYLPVFWTDIYLQLQTQRWLPAQEAAYRQELAAVLGDRIAPTGSYFTVLEYDHMIWEWDRFPRNVAVCSAGGWGDVPIPLLLRSPAFTHPPKDIRVSFLGRMEGYGAVTSVRDRMKAVMQDHAHFGQGPHWREVMGRSVFSLCPRGLGRASFRLCEALSVGSIPIYLWDDVEWLPWRDELDWSEFSLSVNVAELDSLPARLAAISDEQVRRMQRRIAELYDDYFTLPGTCQQIHKRVEQLADPERFDALMRARPYLPGTVPPPVPAVA